MKDNLLDDRDRAVRIQILQLRLIRHNFLLRYAENALVMMDSMFTVPTDTDVVKCIVTKEAAEGTAQPQMIRAEGGQVKKAASKKAVHRNEDEIA